MNFDELLAKVNARWVNGSFSLEQNYIPSDTINKLLGWITASGSLEVKQASAPVGDREKQTITIASGIMSGRFLDLTEPSLNLVFSLAEGKAALTIILKGKANGFKLSMAFPSLADYAIGSLLFNDCMYTLHSDTKDSNTKRLQEQYAGAFYLEEIDPAVHRGLHVSLQLKLPAELDWIKTLLNKEELRFSGYVDIIQNVPRFRLACDLVSNVQIGYLKFSIGFELVSLYFATKTEPREFQAIPLLRLTSSLVFQLNGADVTIPSSVIFSEMTPTGLLFESELTEASSAALRAFSGLLHGIQPHELLPEGMPVVDQVVLQHFSFYVSTSDLKLKNVSVTFGLKNEKESWPIIPGVLDLQKIKLNFQVMNPLSADRTWLALAEGDILLNKKEFGPVRCSFALPSLLFSVALAPEATANINALVESFIPLPSGLPPLSLSEAWFEGGINPRVLSFGGSLNTGSVIDFDWFKLESLGLSFEYANGSFQGSSFRFSASLLLAKKIYVFLKAVRANNSWTFSGSFINAPEDPVTLGDLFPSSVKLPDFISKIVAKSGSLSFNLQDKTFSFALDGEIKLDFGPEVGSLLCKGISIRRTKSGQTFAWEITSKGGIKILPFEWEDDQPAQPLIAIEGTLKVSQKNKEFEASFISDPGSSVIRNIPVLIPYKITKEDGLVWSRMNFYMNEITIGKNTGGWYFDSDFDFRFTKVIPAIEKALNPKGEPEGGKVNVLLKVEKGSATVTLKSNFGVEIPDFKIPENGEIKELNLGKSHISFGKFAFTIGKKIEVSCGLTYKLPQRANHLLGTDEATGKPNIDLLETYDPLKPGEGRSLDVEFYANFKSGRNGRPGIGARVIDLPFKPLEPDPEEKGFYFFNLGPKVNGHGKYGCVRFKIPGFEFDFGKGGFKLSAAFEIVKDFAVPLDPLKKLLETASLKPVADRLPETLPIPVKDPPDLVTNGNIDVEKVKKLYFTHMRSELPAAFVKLITDIATVYGRLPLAFREFVVPKSPYGFAFDLVIKPDASVDITVSAKDELKFIMPKPPFFFDGIRLRSFSFGTLFGGKLFMMRVDADIEKFDLAHLFLSLAVNDPEYHRIFGDPQKFQTKLTINKLFLAIIYQTKIPIPVPLFYEKLGIDYYGIGGIGFKIAAGLKEPSFDILEMLKILGDLIRFVTQPKYPLPLKGPDKFDLQFKFGPAYIKAPEIIGGKNYGLETEFAFPSLYEIFARIANSIKFMDVTHLLGTVPLDHRFQNGSGTTRFQFLFITIDVQYLLTTPQEFVETSRAKFELDEDQAKTWLKIIPGPKDPEIKPTDSAVIVFMRGNFTVSGSSLKIVFGLAGSDVREFRGGLHISGNVHKIFDLDLYAFTRVSQTQPYFHLYGQLKTKIQLGTLPVFAGETTIHASRKHFYFDGNFEVLKANEVFYLYGQFKGNFDATGFEIGGKAGGKLIIFELHGTGIMGSNGVGLSLGLQGLPTSGLSVKKEGENIAVRGSLFIVAVQFTASVVFKPAVNPFLKINLDSQDILDVLKMGLEFTLDAYSSKVEGQVKLVLLGIEALNTRVTLEGNKLSAHDWFNLTLTPEIYIRVHLRGSIEPTRFHLSGNGKIRCFLPEVDCHMVVSSEAIGGGFSFWGAGYAFRIGLCSNKQVIAIKGGLIALYVENGHIHWGNPCGLAFDGKSVIASSVEGCKLKKVAEILVETIHLSHNNEKIIKAYRGSDWKLIEVQRKNGHELALEARRIKSEKHGNHFGLKYTLRPSRSATYIFRSLKKIAEAPVNGKKPRRKLNIDGAYARVEIAMIKKAHQHKITLFFPAQKEKELQKISVSFKGPVPFDKVVAKIRTALHRR